MAPALTMLFKVWRSCTAKHTEMDATQVIIKLISMRKGSFSEKKKENFWDKSSQVRTKL